MQTTDKAVDYRTLNWDENDTAWRYRSGRKVSQRGMKAIIDQQTANMKSNQGWSLWQLKEGKMTFEEFQQFNAKMIRDHHVFMARMGKGGSDRMSDADYLAVQQELKQNQLNRFERFMNGVKEGQYSDRYIADRLGKYADGTKVSYETARLKAYGEGHEGLRQLGNCKNHCDPCIYYASLGWQPLNLVVPPGKACRCGARCCCSVTVRKR